MSEENQLTSTQPAAAAPPAATTPAVSVPAQQPAPQTQAPASEPSMYDHPSVAAGATQQTEPSQQRPPEGQPPTQQQVEDYRTLLSQRGFDVSKYSYSQLADAFVNAATLARQARELQPYADVGRHYQEHWSDFQEYLKTKQQPSQQPTQQEAPKSWLDVPEWKAEWNRYIELDEQGNARIRPGSGGTPEILGKYQKYQQFLSDFNYKFQTNPAEAFEGLTDHVKNTVLEEARRELDYREQLSYSKGLLRENSNWILDGQGNFTEAGKRYSESVKQLSQMGVKDPKVTHNIAKMAASYPMLVKFYQDSVRRQQNPGTAQTSASVGSNVQRQPKPVQQPFMAQHVPSQAATNNAPPKYPDNMSLHERALEDYKREFGRYPT